FVALEFLQSGTNGRMNVCRGPGSFTSNDRGESVHAELVVVVVFRLTDAIGVQNKNRCRLDACDFPSKVQITEQTDGRSAATVKCSNTSVGSDLQRRIMASSDVMHPAPDRINDHDQHCDKHTSARRFDEGLVQDSSHVFNRMDVMDKRAARRV